MTDNTLRVAGVKYMFHVNSDSYQEKMLIKESKQTKTKSVESKVKVNEQQRDV